MAPTPTTYSLRSQGQPTTTVERPIRLKTTVERPVRVQKVSTKVVENEEIEATQAQLAAKAVIDAFQPVVSALTLQVTQLTAALKEQRIGFTR